MFLKKTNNNFICMHTLHLSYVEEPIDDQPKSHVPMLLFFCLIEKWVCLYSKSKISGFRNGLNFKFTLCPFSPGEYTLTIISEMGPILKYNHRGQFRHHHILLGKKRIALMCTLWYDTLKYPIKKLISIK